MAPQIIFLVLFLPLLGALINGLLMSAAPLAARKKTAGPIASAAVGLAFVCALLLFGGLGSILGDQAWLDVHGYDWINIGGLSIPFALRIDPLSVTMMLVVTGVGFMIHLFSIAYMAHDERVYRYFTYLNLFTFAMLLLVLANNFVLMFVGWEGVGLCSYLLIGFWFERVSAAQAGKKAFLVNRVGDFGFLLALFAIFHFSGTLIFNTPEHSGVFDQAAQFNQVLLWGIPAVTVICLLLFLGAAGKSAQLPLYLWLPDAMEGPTPVSALIHAATMVTAGVYMVARSAALFGQSSEAQFVVATVGIVTAFWAALVAIKQYDIKRVLAYSTVSQLGFMFVGVGVGAYAAGISHLVTHAFFKALMFLGAGAVMHALDGQLDMRKMGNLRRHLKWTFLTFAVGWYAICGLPLGPAFFSKDAILEGALHHGYTWIFWAGVGVAAMTAFYMTRMFVTVFFGSERIEMGDEGHGGHDGHEHDHDHAHGHSHDHGHGKHQHVHVHPEPLLQNVPLIVLAAFSAIGGLLVVPILQGWLDPVTVGMIPDAVGNGSAAAAHGAAEAAHGAADAAHGAGHAASTWEWGALISREAMISGAAGVAGVLVAWLAYGPEKFGRGWTPSQERMLGFLANSYEGAMHFVFVRVGTRLAEFFGVFDRLIIDGAVNGAAAMVNGLADSLRSLQTGYVRNYALVMLAGTVFVIACFMVILQGLELQLLLKVLGGLLGLILLINVGVWIVERLHKRGVTKGTH